MYTWGVSKKLEPILKSLPFPPFLSNCNETLEFKRSNSNKQLYEISESYLDIVVQHYLENGSGNLAHFKSDCFLEFRNVFGLFLYTLSLR